MKQKSGPSNQPLRVGLVSLGCAKNLVDAEVILGALLASGLEIVNDASQADAIIVNTCSFIDAAQEESVDAILETGQARDSSRPAQALVVAGCLPQRFRDDLPELFPEVDAFMGIDQVPRAGEIVKEAIARRHARQAAPKTKPGAKAAPGIVKKLGALDKKNPAPATGEQIRGGERFGKTLAAVAPPAPLIDVTARPQFVPDVGTPRFRLTPPHFAYLKIAEGCNHPCSFCIIPRIRGSHRSRPPLDVVREARGLLKDGVRELNLISQDTTAYGQDLHRRPKKGAAAPDKTAPVHGLAAGVASLPTLLQELNSMTGDYWVRLLYTHPAHWTDELIDTIARCQKVARYIDIPLQHIHDDMLQRMRRETSRDYIEQLLGKIRARLPGIVIRTTFIVGFPGETEKCFESLLEFMRQARFERLGVFAYSKEDGTVAGKMAGQLSDKVKQDRRQRAMALQRQIAREISGASVGRTLKVLVEREAAASDLAQAAASSWEHGLIREAGGKRLTLKGRYMAARAEGDAPDIDGRVYVKGRLPAGEFASVRIVGHTDYDLIAEPA